MFSKSIGGREVVESPLSIVVEEFSEICSVLLDSFLLCEHPLNEKNNKKTIIFFLLFFFIIAFKNLNF
tara:strand:- start:528 stop:731 length:204 start_codon:yes stop_codon:yes gene_type:complete